MDQLPASPGLGARQIAAAVFDPLGALVLGGAGLAFAVTHAVPVIAVGGLAWATLVSLKLLARPSPAGGEQDALPEPREFMDPAVTAQIGALRRARDERAVVLAESPVSVRDSMGAALDGVPELEQHAVVLARRAESLGDYLRTQDRGAITSDARRMADAAKGTSDAQAAAEYGRAVAERGEQIRALDDIAGARDRALANLSRIVSALSALPAKIVRMRALDDAALDALGGDVSADLARLNEELRLFENTLSSLAQGVEPMPTEPRGPAESKGKKR